MMISENVTSLLLLVTQTGTVKTVPGNVVVCPARSAERTNFYYYCYYLQVITSNNHIFLLTDSSKLHNKLRKPKV